MTKLYKAIQGKKANLIGEGSTLIESINDANIIFYDDVQTDEDKESYVKSAVQDYVVEVVNA